MIGTVATLDACVLYPAPLRDFLMRLAVSQMYEPRWSREIHEEWIRNLSEDRADLTREKLERTRDLMDAAIPAANVTGYEELIAGISLPDSDDRHVLAATIHGKATVSVTLNLRDFPKSALEEFGVTPLHPDEFVCALFREKPRDMIAAIARHRGMLHKPPKSAAEYVATLRQNGLRKMAEALAGHLDEI